jgi:hypothetical protein
MFMSCFGSQVLRCTFTPPVKSRIDDRIYPSKGELFLPRGHSLLPERPTDMFFCAPCLSNMENITVKDFSRHMSQILYVITVSPQSCRSRVQ